MNMAWTSPGSVSAPAGAGNAMSSGGPDSSATGRAGGHPSNSGKGYSKSGPAANKPRLIICCRPAQTNSPIHTDGLPRRLPDVQKCDGVNKQIVQQVGAQPHQCKSDRVNLPIGGTSHCTSHACWIWLRITAGRVPRHSSAETDWCLGHQKVHSQGAIKEQQIQQKREGSCVPKLNVTVALSFCSGRV